MKYKVFILGIALLPLVVKAQSVEKCADVVSLSKELYDNFQSLKSNLAGSEQEIAKYRETRDEIMRKYLGCEKQEDVAAMVKQAEDNLQRAEGNRKTWAESFARVDVKIRQFIDDNRGKQVEYRFLDPFGGGNLGKVVTMTFTIQEGKVVIIPSYYQLPDPNAH